jgi:hypothetical protein
MINFDLLLGVILNQIAATFYPQFGIWLLSFNFNLILTICYKGAWIKPQQKKALPIVA